MGGSRCVPTWQMLLASNILGWKSQSKPPQPCSSMCLQRSREKNLSRGLWGCVSLTQRSWVRPLSACPSLAARHRVSVLSTGRGGSRTILTVHIVRSLGPCATHCAAGKTPQVDLNKPDVSANGERRGAEIGGDIKCSCLYFLLRMCFFSFLLSSIFLPKVRFILWCFLDHMGPI